MRTTEMKSGLLGAAILALAIAPGNPAAAEVAMEPVKPTPVAADLERGARLYERYCAQCHGTEGEGDGPAADYVYPRPRDFTLALYKVRSTLSGQVPTDHDLFATISNGLPGTSMPGWRRFLSDNERWQLVHYVKTFDAFGVFEDEPARQQIAIGAPPKVTPELIEQGAEVYEDKKCWQCHGPLGRGDGVSAAGLKDDWGHAIRPVNFTKSWRFRGGDRLEDIYRTFTTGFNGTPMPTFLKAIPEAEDRWALAAYVQSLASPRRESQVLRAERHAGDIPGDADDPAWGEIEAVDFLLAGQIILEPRWFTPSHDVVSAKALYNDREVALLVIWDDGTRDDGGDGKPADQVALQFPLESPDALAGEKPYFIHGDRKHGIDLWRWTEKDGLVRNTAFGHGRVETVPAGSVSVEGSYKDGQYRVIFRRPLADAGNEAAIAPGVFVPIAFQLWDGSNGEEGLKMALSAWYNLLLVPETPFTVHLWPVVLGIGAFAGQIVLVRRMRRRREDENEPG